VADEAKMVTKFALEEELFVTNVEVLPAVVEAATPVTRVEDPVLVLDAAVEVIARFCQYPLSLSKLHDETHKQSLLEQGRWQSRWRRHWHWQIQHKHL